MFEAMKIPRCPDPTNPGLFLCRKIPRASVFVVKIERNEDGCLIASSVFDYRIPISEFGPHAKWWGPIELKR